MHRTWNWKMIILKCLVITLGVFLAGLGCASYLKAALGSDPVTAFVEGLGKTLGITAGAAHEYSECFGVCDIAPV